MDMRNKCRIRDEKRERKENEEKSGHEKREYKKTGKK
jgi:hypothetical protein